jgi:succinate-semialdehyde dehydrogenase/glutarate-semialdehyde dehydrogenase
MRAAAPVLAGGNGLVLKHASNVPQCALAIEQVFAEAGVPTGLCPTLLVGAAAVPALPGERSGLPACHIPQAPAHHRASSPA